MRDVIYGVEPAVAIFGDDAVDRDHAAALVAAAGARVAGSVPVGAALEQLDLQAADAVLVMAGDTPEAELAPLLDHLADAADCHRYHSVVVLPPAQIDAVVAHAWHEGVTLVCGGTALETVGALSLALAPRQIMLHERKDDTPAELRRLREEVGRIARALAEVSGQERRLAAPPPAGKPNDAPVSKAVLGATVRAMIRSRRQRDHFFTPDLFADPAWDMMLDLMLARIENRLVAVSSLCIASAVPPTTALRWIKRLTDEGIFIRSSDPRDGRRIFIDLSEETTDRMNAFLASVAANWTLNG